MSEVLGRVTTELEVERGPDAELRVSMPPPWFGAGSTLRVEVPRRLPCATCHGGGCDRCERSGGVVTATGEGELEPLELVMPARVEQGGDWAIRVPHRGGLAREPGTPAGHLLVILARAAEPSAGVTRIATSSQERRDAERALLMRRSLFVAVGLILTFVGLLRLSGWL
ncbi:MAG TPA: hypothetical protein VLC09_10280 [Polyangiaceae bacterium]|nr:hypothetical protein [Polyangiaceae bacterium]